MFYKFIGKDGSMGLKQGGIYDCRLKYHDGFYWVYWNIGRCPYETMKSLERNWELWR